MNISIRPLLGTCLALLALATGNANASLLSDDQIEQCGCDYVVPENQYRTDGEALGIEPGQSICFAAGAEYRKILLENLNGTEEDRITVKNCGGQAHIDHGLYVSQSSQFNILGNGDPEVEYGLRVRTESSYFMSLGNFSTNFEVAHVEVAGYHPYGIGPDNGFAGIGVKTLPKCDHSADRDVWNAYDVRIHDNYIHDTGGEGMYIGHGFYDGRVEKWCKGDPNATPTLPHAIRGLRVYNNLVERVGYDGIQVKNADTDAQIYNNTIIDYGNLDDGNHNEGLFVGDGTEALIFNNYVEDGPGFGIQANFFGNTSVFNNVVVNAEQGGIYFNNNSVHFSNEKDGLIRFYHNTVINSGGAGFTAYTPQDVEVYNNIFASPTQGRMPRGSNLDVQGNLVTTSPESVGFVDLANNDFHLLDNSAAINRGLYQSLVSDDFDGKQRHDGAPDIGAYEYGTALVEGKMDLSNASVTALNDWTTNAVGLIDEQTAAGDPRNGNGQDVVSNFVSNRGDQAISALIDLGQPHSLNDICFYDRNGHSDMRIETGAEGNWTVAVSDALDTYRQWRCQSVNVSSRYIKVTLDNGLASMPEIVLYGLQ
ncbi:hypothetical protein BGP77_04315 [Saccharospirillum sp. MSK14-1]|uniref:right-handed parallel beta-helix repeat-containing protein n=1 Tax=Saccharospirillum sp. MSK14-1 TaxID=1897632 RepID=UPI000D3C0863|nr:right-handed parallel beta-helix repeat-containing protein [Saccharospirillum sp. MSK14-1]PTY36527.1 hypothetical protein BGP77_04315 [Saccharospirillum sp. MSK14-1]